MFDEKLQMSDEAQKVFLYPDILIVQRPYMEFLHNVVSEYAQTFISEMWSRWTVEAISTVSCIPDCEVAVVHTLIKKKLKYFGHTTEFRFQNFFLTITDIQSQSLV